MLVFHADIHTKRMPMINQQQTPYEQTRANPSLSVSLCLESLSSLSECAQSVVGVIGGK